MHELDSAQKYVLIIKKMPPYFTDFQLKIFHIRYF